MTLLIVEKGVGEIEDIFMAVDVRLGEESRDE